MKAPPSRLGAVPGAIRSSSRPISTSDSSDASSSTDASSEASRDTKGLMSLLTALAVPGDNQQAVGRLPYLGGGVMSMLQMSPAQSAKDIKQNLDKMAPTTDRSISNLDKLADILAKEVQKYRSMRMAGFEVAKNLHDLLREMTGSHPSLDNLHVLAQMMCQNAIKGTPEKKIKRKRKHKSKHRSSQHLQSSPNQLTREVPPVAPSPHQIFKQTSKQLSKALDKLVNEEPPPQQPPEQPSTNINDNSAEELRAAQAKWDTEKQELKTWASNLRAFYEKKQRAMRAEFDKTVADMRSKIIEDSSETSKMSESMWKSQLDIARRSEQDALTKLNEARNELVQIHKNVDSSRSQLLELRQKYEDTNSALRKAEDLIENNRQNLNDESSRLREELERRQEFILVTEQALKMSQSQVTALEQQVTELQESNVEAEQVKGRFRRDMALVKEKLNTLQVLINDLQKELEYERRIRFALEQQLQAQKDFIDHAEIMVAESDSRAAANNEEIAKYKLVAKKARDQFLAFKDEYKNMKDSTDAYHQGLAEANSEIERDARFKKEAEERFEKDGSKIKQLENDIQEIEGELNKYKRAADSNTSRNVGLEERLQRALEQLREKEIQVQNLLGSQTDSRVQSDKDRTINDLTRRCQDLQKRLESHQRISNPGELPMSAANLSGGAAIPGGSHYSGVSEMMNKSASNKSQRIPVSQIGGGWTFSDLVITGEAHMSDDDASQVDYHLKGHVGKISD